MSNPMIARWSGPFGGVPPFDQVKVEHFEPAFEAAMAEELAEVEAIAANPEPASFENTIAAFERAGRTLDRVDRVYGVFASTMSSDEFQAVERTIEPRLAAFRDRIVQDERLFGRIEAVHDSRERSGLTPEQSRLAWLRYQDFARSGARLDAESKKKLSDINQQLATLYTQFSQNVLADEKTAIVLTREEELAGLPDSFREAAAEAAKERGERGYAILNTRSSVEPFLTYSSRRDLREKVWRAFMGRGDNGNGTDNKDIIARIVRLRSERARLLGYPSHAHWRVEMSMAKTPERAIELMEALWKPAVGRVAEEVADMQAIADREAASAGQAPITIEPWDYRYYAEKVRKSKYDIDDNEVMPYLQLENLREAMFWVAGELLGLAFRPAPGVPVYHPDVRVWEVVGANGRHVALFYFDPYARNGKSSGAWMNAYRAQQRLDGDVTTIVSNNCNFVKGRPGEPILVSWDDAVTLFHEFGHALHGISSDVTYPSLSGTNVDRDYVEFPSQLIEHWLATPEVLDRYARHCRTGEAIPRELVKKIERASRFNKGFENVEYLSSALVDMRMHLEPAKVGDVDAFERETLASLGMPPQMVMRHRLPHFGHLFSGDAYSAGYYSYLWADTLSADAFEAFTEAGSAYDKAVAKRLRDHVFAAGNTVDPAEGYRAFRGRDAQIDAPHAPARVRAAARLSVRVRAGVVGAGAMGLGITKAMLARGIEVHARDVVPGREMEAIALGARRLHAPVDVLVSVVVDADQTREVVRDHAHLAPFFMMCSTIAPGDAEAIARELQVRGVAMLDAPVSGGPGRAHAGTLSMMAAGSDAAFEACRPAFEKFTAKCFRVSARPGDGSRMKIVNNMCAAANLAAGAEAMALAARLGLDLAQVADVVQVSSGQSWMFESTCRGRWRPTTRRARRPACW